VGLGSHSSRCVQSGIKLKADIASEISKVADVPTADIACSDESIVNEPSDEAWFVGSPLRQVTRFANFRGQSKRACGRRPTHSQRATHRCEPHDGRE